VLYASKSSSPQDCSISAAPVSSSNAGPGRVSTGYIFFSCREQNDLWEVLLRVALAIIHQAVSRILDTLFNPCSRLQFLISCYIGNFLSLLLLSNAEVKP
jgi:hypothetical protein